MMTVDAILEYLPHLDFTLPHPNGRCITGGQACNGWGQGRLARVANHGDTTVASTSPVCRVAQSGRALAGRGR